MKFTIMFKTTGWILNHASKKAGIDKVTLEKVQKEYRTIVERSSDIGVSNRLLGSYALAAYFIAMNRQSGLSVEENYRIMYDGLKASKLYKAAMGSADNYFSEKNMDSRRVWSQQTHERRYANDWVVDVIEKTDDFEFGFDYTECGACKLFKDEGCFEWAHYLCALDFMTTEMMGVHLERTETLAEGGDRCDFRFSRM